MAKCEREEKLEWRYRNGHFWMFDEKDISIRNGADVKTSEEQTVISSKLDNLKKVEDHFSTLINKYDFGVTFDLNAREKPYFDNINYTSLLDMFIVHPLSPELSHHQTMDALTYFDDSDFDYVQYYKDMVLSDNMNKYVDRKKASATAYDAVVVLPGLKWIRKALCLNKMLKIVENHGKRAIFKPHPLTNRREFEDIMLMLPSHASVVMPSEDVYEYIINSEIVYTSGWSETALTAAALGKNIEPIHTWQDRMFGSFSHISQHIFNADKKDRKYLINKILNSYRSGVINPVVQPDWKDRLEKYLDYINTKRSHIKTHYVKRS